MVKLEQLLTNLEDKGLLIFDVRTHTGWQVDFFQQKVTIYETNNFQRLWINLPEPANQQITFDIFIRVKDQHNHWLAWEREQMTERMWALDEVKQIVSQVGSAKIINIYRDDFSILDPSDPEPNLAYFVLQKVSS